MATTAQHLMSDDIFNEEYQDSKACIVQAAGKLHEKLIRALHRHDTLSLGIGDLPEFLKLFAAEFKKLIDEADKEAEELLEKAEQYEENEDAIDYWKRICDETSATDADDVIQAFEKADKLDEIIYDLREYS